MGKMRKKGKERCKNFGESNRLGGLHLKKKGTGSIFCWQVGKVIKFIYNNNSYYLYRRTCRKYKKLIIICLCRLLYT